MINKFFENKLVKQIVKFGLVGGLAFIIDYAVLIICKELFSLPILLATAIGFIVSVIFNYIASIKWVFDVNKERSTTKQFIVFIVFSVIGLLITELIMWVGTDIFDINYLFVKIVATAIVMVFNFITRKMFLE